MANRFKKTGEYISCKTCSKSVYLMPCEVKLGRKKYCSKDCLYKGDSYTNLFEKGHKDFVPKESRGHTEESKKKISTAQLGRCGELSNSWKGGVSKIDKLVRRMKEYLNWRKLVFEKDNFKCSNCGYVGYITAHHIKSFVSILRENNIKNIIDARSCEELWDINNGKTLCEECHKKTDNYKGRGRLKKLTKILS